MDDNKAERLLRGVVMGRRLSFGSDSETGTRVTALMDSVVGTLALNGIDVLRWLEVWLGTCAENRQKRLEFKALLGVAGHVRGRTVADRRRICLCGCHGR